MLKTSDDRTNKLCVIQVKQSRHSRAVASDKVNLTFLWRKVGRQPMLCCNHDCIARDERREPNVSHVRSTFDAAAYA